MRLDLLRVAVVRHCKLGLGFQVAAVFNLRSRLLCISD